MEEPIQLNLVLHGTWGIEENRPGSGHPPIRLVTFEDHHHSILAGDRDNPSTPLRAGEYELRVDTAGDPKQRFDAGVNATVTPADNGGKPLHGNGDRIISINLPHAQNIHSVRRHEIKGERLFETAIPKTGTHIALVQILEYTVKAIANLSLEPLPLNWGALMNNGARVINLHLFAEPDRKQFDEILKEERDNPGREKHFKRVFKELGRKYGLEMIPAMAVDPVPNIEAPNPIKGIDWRDTVGLHELRNRPAVSPVNCDMCVFNNY